MRWQALVGAVLCVQLGSGFASPALSSLRAFGYGDSAAAKPTAEVLQGRDGVLYGTTPAGGNSGQGTVFCLSTNGTGFRLLKSFGAAPADGARPVAALLEGSDGALYGTTTGGGSFGHGTVFRLSEDGSTYSVLWHFTGATDGANPEARLLEASDGFLYGTASGGGTNDYGVVFRLAKDGSGFQSLFQFSGTNGANPEGGLLEASDGQLYGTTTAGNIAATYRLPILAGTVFSLDKSGTNFTLLQSFLELAYPGQGSAQQTNGYAPYGKLIEGADGRLYGITSAGGTNGNGTVYCVAKDGTGYQVLYHFQGGSNADGRVPLAELLLASDGLLYGTTYDGGASNCGTLFRIGQDGSNYAVFANLSGAIGPAAALSVGTDGLLYGTTQLGGASGAGTVFKVNKDGSGFTVLVNFSATGGDGQSPDAVPTLATDGRFYSTTRLGGSRGVGSLFALRFDGLGYQQLATLDGANGGPVNPMAGVIEGTNGVLYGVSQSGGPATNGTLFGMQKDGSGLTTLYSPLGSTNGQEPRATLLQGSDGALYGTTVLGGANGQGVLFRADPGVSSYTALKSFVPNHSSTAVGANPVQGVIEGSDHVLYGTTYDGGGSDSGVVYKINKDGTGYTLMKSFTGTVTDGGYPASPLLEGQDGFLYGTTYGGGSTNNGGAVFRIAKNGTGFQMLHGFIGLNGDARHPCGKLVQGTDGMLYGTTERGGANNDSGALFTISTNGTGYAVLASFGGTLGAYPHGGLTTGPDGALYGTTDQGGTLGLGTVFRYGAPVEEIAAFQFSPGVATLTCIGSAGTNYWFERTDSLGATASWTSFYSTNAPASGQFSVQDLSPLPGAGFYRMRR